MFVRARLRLTLWYVGLTVAILTAMASALSLVVAGEIRGADDLELRLRAERLGRIVAAKGIPSPGGEHRPFDRDDGDNDHDRHEPVGDVGFLERAGLLAYAISPEGNRSVALSEEIAPGLPDLSAATATARSGRGAYATLTTPAGQVRAYSLPVLQGENVVAVIQVARSGYFVAQTVGKLLAAALGFGGLAVLAAAGAGYWLSGLAMRPIVTAMQRQRDFVADASHELRTPLTLVRGNAELLLRHRDQTVGQNLDLVQDIVDETDRLSRLVADLLTLARADSGQIEIARHPVDLSEVVAGLAEDMRSRAIEKGLQLNGEVTPGLIVLGDADRLRQLGLILVDNAITYTNVGAVTLRLSRDREGAILEVADTGIGIPEDHLPLIFERFYRVDAARGSTAGGGTGLGLSIARWIAEAHGGAISAASTPGKGTVFTVRLPNVVA